MPQSDAPLLPGLKPVLDLLKSSPDQIVKIQIRKDWRPPDQLYELARHYSVPLEPVPLGQLDRLCANGQHNGSQTSHQGVVAVLSQAKLVTVPELLALCPQSPLPLVIALDQIRDPGNLGAMARTAYAMGCAGLILPRHNSASPGPGALRSSAGALASLPLCMVPNLARALDDAAETGFAIYGAGCGTANCADAFSFDWQLPCVLVMGSEEKGMRPGVAKRCSTLLNIPLARKFDSLNVAQACAILIALCSKSTRKF